MTPQLVLSRTAPQDSHSGAHLNEDQFGDLLALSPADATPEHLLACDACAAEVAAIRESLAVFRDASRAYADNELRRMPQMALPSRRLISPAMQPAWWLAAAATLLVALSPMQMQRMRTIHQTAQVAGSSSTANAEQSDEALLDDVDREASASVPSPMQALASPSTALDASTPLATQGSAF